MGTTVENISSTKKRLKIEIPTDILEKEYRASLDNVRQRAKIPGFRPGKAPERMIEKKFGNDIKTDIIDRLVPEYYSKALKEAELVPVTMPKFESNLDIKINEPLSFSLTVEVRPDISGLSYTGLKVGAVDVEVDEKEIGDTINGLQEERALFEVVDREIREGDLLVIDYVKLDPSSKKEVASAKDQIMNMGNNMTPQGILDGLLGRKKGDTVDITLPSFEGSEVKEENKGDILKITIKEVKEKSLPAVDDDFAKDFGHDTLEALKEKIREGIRRAKNEKVAKDQKSKLLDKLVEAYEFDLPESLLDKELETLVVNEKYSKKKTQELINDAENQPTAGEEDETAVAGRLRPKAVSNVKASILLDVIAEKEGITVAEEEIKTRIALLAKHFQTTPDAVINLFIAKDGSLDNFRNTIRDEKVLDLILSKAEFTEGEGK